MFSALPFARRAARSLVLLTACGLFVPRALPAAEPKADPEAQKVKVDPQAQKVVDALGKFFAGLKGFRFTAHVALHIEQAGKRQTQEFEQRFGIERPNKFSYQLDSERGDATVVSDGRELTVYVEGFQKYAVEQAPPTLAALFKDPLIYSAVAVGNASTVTMALASDDPAARLVEQATAVEYGGLVELNRIKCHLLKASGELDWQLWIDAGTQPLVRQFIPDVATALERRAKAQGQESPFKDTKIANVITFKEWQIDPVFAADAFAFDPPKDAQRVDTILDIAKQQPQELPPHPLLGMPAPPIELPLLDGGKLDLASYKGKKVVMLDFWATWCGPCREVMPIVDKVAEKFKDKGVVLFTINVGETPDDVRAFLESAKLKVPVALDQDETVALSYKTEFFPQTVLIGKDGVIQAVKLGATPDIEQALTADLEALIAGKSLTDKQPEKQPDKPQAPAN